MGQFLDMMLAGAKRSRGYTEKLLVGIDAAQAARKPDIGGRVIDTNHPAFVFGHLSLYAARQIKVVGKNGDHAAAPAEWDALFKAGVACQDDAAGTIYPAFETILAQYFKGLDAVFAAYAGLDDAALLAITPEERTRETFPTVGSLVNFLLNNHVMVHMGQVSVWRRCMGLPSAV
jgi:hypothetical protein